ncbi:HD domain-containing protein [Streptomyces sp. CA-106110]|uniref:HD domain-containing protein n=1 Tax=Streptomyces sp. CA-106110 TaxID=3240044 RepID=UPI003D9178CE
MPSALDTPQGAAELAESLLPPLGNRWLHTQAVAARAREVAAAVSEDARDLLVAAAWLHDIGYALELRETGFHPLDGARHLERLGAPARLVRLVAHHSGAVYEAEQRGLTAELAVYEREDSSVSDALTCADMTTGPAGQSFDFDQAGTARPRRRRAPAGVCRCTALPSARCCWPMQGKTSTPPY